jgi:hypothetical protein
MGPIGCNETSVLKQLTKRRNPEDVVEAYEVAQLPVRFGEISVSWTAGLSFWPSWSSNSGHMNRVNILLNELLRFCVIGASVVIFVNKLAWILCVPHRALRQALCRNQQMHLWITYKMVQIWPGQTVTCLHTNSPGHIWTALYVVYWPQLHVSVVFCDHAQGVQY